MAGAYAVNALQPTALSRSQELCDRYADPAQLALERNAVLEGCVQSEERIVQGTRALSSSNQLRTMWIWGRAGVEPASAPAAATMRKRWPSGVTS